MSRFYLLKIKISANIDLQRKDTQIDLPKMRRLVFKGMKTEEKCRCHKHIVYNGNCLVSVDEKHERWTKNVKALKSGHFKASKLNIQNNWRS